MEKEIKLTLSLDDFNNIKSLVKFGLVATENFDHDTFNWETYDNAELPKCLKRVDNDFEDDAEYTSAEIFRYMQLQFDTHDDIYEVFQIEENLPNINFLEEKFGKIFKGRDCDHLENLAKWGYENYELDELPGNVLLFLTKQEFASDDKENIWYEISYKLDSK